MMKSASLWAASSSMLCLSILGPTHAEVIVPDSTLGNDSSQVISPTQTQHHIEAGAIRGSSLFHSFETFNVQTGHQVYFSNPDGIQDIFSRVTGSQSSNILGTLGVKGDASLFLLNPNGLLFGPDATLDIGGSFVGTTANQFKFENGLSFSAVAPTSPPLLNIGISPGLQLGQIINGTIQGNDTNQGTIRNQANLTVGQDLYLEASNLEIQGQLHSGKNLTLRSHNTLTIRDTPTAPFLTSSGGQLLLQGDRYLDIFTLNHPSSRLVSGQDLILRSAIPIIGDARYTSGGSFLIQLLDQTPGSFRSPNDPVIRAAGDVSFSNYTGTSLHILAGGQVTGDRITITGAAAGAATEDFLQETVTLSDGQTLKVDGGSRPTLDIRSGVLSTALKAGSELSGQTDGFSAPVARPESVSSADITLDSVKIEAPNGQVFLSSQYQPNLGLEGGSISIGELLGDDQGGSLFQGDATDVTIDSRLDFVVGDRVDVSAATGSPGEMKLLAAQDVRLDESYLITNNNGPFLPGNLSIQADTLTATNGAQLRVNTAGFSDAGSVRIQLSGDAIFDGLRSSLGNQNNREDRAGIDNHILNTNLDDTPTVKSSGIMLNARNITVSNGAQLQARVEANARGESGKIQLNATDTITITGLSSDLTPNSIDPDQPITPSFVTTNLELNAEGKPGDLFLQADHIRITEGASVQTNTNGRGSAGALSLKARESILVQGRVKDNERERETIVESRVDVDGFGDAGEVVLEAPLVEILDGAFVNSAIEGNFGSDGRVGDVIVRADGGLFRLDNRSQLNANIPSTGTGQSGDIFIDAAEVEISGASFVSTNSIPKDRDGTRDRGRGNAGSITINASDNVKLFNFGFIATSVNELGSLSGNVTVNTRRFEMDDGSVIFAGSHGRLPTPQGKQGGGDVTITASEGIQLTNGSLVLSQQYVNSRGDAGNIRLEAPDILISSDARVSSITETIGRGGNVELLGKRLTISDGGQVDAGTTNVGDAGQIQVRVDALEVNSKGQIRSSTTAAGAGGNIEVEAIEKVLLAGQDSGLYATSEEQSTSNSGSINIRAPLIEIRDQGRVSISVQDLSTGDGGDVELRANQAILLANQGLIETDAGGSGDGGNVLINAPFVIGLPGENSDIIANARDGSGGDIEVQAEAILNLERRDNPDTLSLRSNTTNDISASSQSGDSGVLNLAGLDVDPTQGSTELPVTLVDPTNLIDRRCDLIANPRSNNRFVQRGRWGIPVASSQSSQDSPFYADLGKDLGPEILLDEIQLNEIQPTAVPNRTQIVQSTGLDLSKLNRVAKSPSLLREAQHWNIDPHGQVQLLAARPVNLHAHPQVCQLHHQKMAQEVQP